MTVALISLAVPQAVIGIFGNAPNPIVLPNGDQIAGAVPGWVSQDSAFSLVNVTLFVVPQGQQTTGQPTYTVLNGVVSQTFQTIAIPASTISAGLYNQALQAGVTFTWSVSTQLNGAYAIDTNTQVALIGEFFATQNFTKTVNWYMKNGTAVVMTPTQADLFGAAVWAYLSSLLAVQAIIASGGQATFPNPSMSITG